MGNNSRSICGAGNFFAGTNRCPYTEARRTKITAARQQYRSGQSQPFVWLLLRLVVVRTPDRQRCTRFEDLLVIIKKDAF